MLRQVFRTQNALTLAVSGTGSAGMETCVVNLIEPLMVLLVGAIVGTTVVYRDTSHLTVDYAQRLTGPFRVAFRQCIFATCPR